MDNDNNKKRPAQAAAQGKDKKRGMEIRANRVDVIPFTEARAFEISAMHNAMEKSRSSAAQRAFQSLPRNLRRRTASFNLNRLPARLRERAQREVESDPVKKGKKPDCRFKRRKTRTLLEEYSKRQGDKQWLETHIWHSKRMKMTDLWGFKLPLHSNENGIRSTYKSSNHQCIIQDMSYFGFMEISGRKKSIVNLFESMFDPSMPSVGSARYTKGTRHFSTFLYEYRSFPQKLVGPASFLWRQVPKSATTTSDMETDDNSLSGNGQLLIWLHPSAFEHALRSVKEAVTALKLEKKVSVKDLESSLVMFDFTGPRSTALLKAVLNPNESDTAEPYQEAHKAWKLLSSLRSSTSVPPGAVISLLVDDPRLTFPQKTDPRQSNLPAQEEKEAFELLSHWPDSIASSSIWDVQEREGVKASMASIASLDKRRSELLIPGTKLSPTETDSRIPVMLLQRQGRPQISRDMGGSDNEYLCGWTLIVPRGWGMPFWKSFIFAGARAGGVRERRSFHFEAGQSCFPYDFPTTKAYDDFASEYKTVTEAKYNRTPVAKRVNYTKMGVDDPFEAPWVKCLSVGATILGFDSLPAPKDDVAMEAKSSGQDDQNTDADKSKDNSVVTALGLDPEKIWLLQSPKLVNALVDAAWVAGGGGNGKSTPEEQTTGSLRLDLQRLNNVVLISLGDMLKQSSILPWPRVEDALVRVGIDFMNRGKISENGMIFAIPEDKYETWLARAKVRGKREITGKPRFAPKPIREWVDLDMEEEDDKEDREFDFDQLATTQPPPGTLIGYVTTGQYCYSDGKSYGIGCCSATGVASVLELETRYKLKHKIEAGPYIDLEAEMSNTRLVNFQKVPRMMVIVRSTRSRVSRLARLNQAPFCACPFLFTSSFHKHTIEMEVHRCRFVDYIPSAINALAFAPKTTRPVMACGRANGDIEIWNPTNDWTLAKIIPGGKNTSVEALAWSHQTILTEDEDFWDSEKEKKRALRKLARAPARLFSAGLNAIVTEWDLVTLKPKRTVDSHGGAVWCMAINNANTVLAVGCEDGCVRLFDIADGELTFIRSFDKQKTRILSLAWSLDDKTIITGSANSAVYKWDAELGRVVTRMTVERVPGEDTLVWSVKVLANGDFVSGDSLGHVKFWDGSSATMVQSFTSHGADVLCLAVSEDGKTVFSSGVDRKCCRYRFVDQVDAPKKLGKRNGDSNKSDLVSKWVLSGSGRSHSHDVRALALNESRNVDALVSGGVDVSMVVCSPSTFPDNNMRRLPYVPQRPVISVSQSQRLMLCRMPHGVKVWRLGKTATPVQPFTELEIGSRLDLIQPQQAILEMNFRDDLNLTASALSEDGHWIAVADIDEVRLFRIENHATHAEQLVVKKQKSFPGVRGTGAHHLTFTPDNQRLVVASTDSQVAIVDLSQWETGTFDILRQFGQHSGSGADGEDFMDVDGNDELGDDAQAETITSMAVSVDGQWLATGDLKRRIFIFNLDTLQTRRLTDWSREHSSDSRFPKKFLDLKDKIHGIAFNPARKNTLMVWGASYVCHVDLDRGVGDRNALLNIGKRKRADQLKEELQKQRRERQLKKYAALGIKPGPELETGEAVVVLEGKKSGKVLATATKTHVSEKKEEINFQLLNKFQPLMYVDFLDDNSMLAVELPFVKILSTLPPSYYRASYGT
ncbi:hypothetical protein BGW38_004904 [Lunasporangiospora selenospora]|uniref:Uncharacterized protein n=1 Tax=Lunasporangiospora selenospora TaxID=979761 RepID=A0A9P6KHA1_9FUNG|nr:hypothetical protein BGW38_004904 [Lunasporangiospora selenospora]